LNLKWLEQNLAREPQLVHERLANTLELVSQTIQTVRRLSTSLHPAILDDFGLAAALEWQVKEFQKHSGIPCYLSTSQQEIELERNCALAVFRICQEALTNVARHAEAAEVRMSLAMEAENLWLRIQDNGRGISPDALTNTRSLGLISMRERALSFDGEFTIYGAPGEGTLIRVRIPLVRQAGNVTT
jgi:signal transduction histidine kinase